MGANLYVYLDPEVFEGDFPWVGSDDYRFQSRIPSELIHGISEAGKHLHQALAPEERLLLTPDGFTEDDDLVLRDPVVLRQTLLKAFDLLAQGLVYGGYDAAMLERLFPGFDVRFPSEIFSLVRRDVAGAVLVCCRAVEKNAGVYWAMG